MKWIGIDTGVNTGLAVWDATTRRLEDVATVGIVAAMERVLAMHRACGRLCLVVEDARKRRWLPRERNVAEYRGRLMGAGSVKRDAAIWQEYAAYYGIPLLLVAPSPGQTKWTPAQLAAVTGWTARTSNHGRDAALLVYGRADTLPASAIY